jgi:predicted nucleotidyltransferase
MVPNMGRMQTNSPGLAGALFSSVQQRVLGLLLGQPDRDFSTSEVIRHAGAGTGAVHRELSRLASSGILAVQRIGNQKRYHANPDSPVFDELRSLVAKTIGLADPLHRALLPLSAKIDIAFVFGSVARREDRAASDIDLLVIGDDLSYAEVFASLESTEAKLGRPINPTVMTAEEWRRKQAV